MYEINSMEIQLHGTFKLYRPRVVLRSRMLHKCRSRQKLDMARPITHRVYLRLFCHKLYNLHVHVKSMTAMKDIRTKGVPTPSVSVSGSGRVTIGIHRDAWKSIFKRHNVFQW